MNEKASLIDALEAEYSRQDMLDTLDEELELELDDGRLQDLAADGEAGAGLGRDLRRPRCCR